MADRQVDRRLRERGLSTPRDVAVIGGGIVGCAAAAFLAEAGVKVDLYERDEVGSAASGRNSGSVQHPFDPVMAELHAET
ncbi:MAG TPA: FAD-dependent oxidoreductase, partial [Thermoleophilaceae bacterium]